MLVGFYTGTRHGAICSAALTQAVGRGYVDTDSGVFHRRRQGARQTNKRLPPVRLPARLLALLRRWKRLGIARHAVVEWNGKPVASVRKSFAAAVRAAGIDRHITPQICRHTAATWAMQQGSDIWEAAGYLGMSPELLERVYGHHHPDFQSDGGNVGTETGQKPREQNGTSDDERYEKHQLFKEHKVKRDVRDAGLGFNPATHPVQTEASSNRVGRPSR
jgi:hypothetical protein